MTPEEKLERVELKKTLNLIKDNQDIKVVLRVLTMLYEESKDLLVDQSDTPERLWQMQGAARAYKNVIDTITRPQVIIQKG